MTVVRALQHGFGLLFLDTSITQRKGEFVTATNGQDGVKQASGWKNVDSGDAKVWTQGLVDRLSNDLWMADGVEAVLFDPRVKRGDIHIVYFLVLPSHGMQSHRTCSTTKKGFAGFQGWYEIE